MRTQTTSGKPLASLPGVVTGSSQIISCIEVPAHADISHESSSERPTKVAPRKHSIYTHFLQDRNSEVCKRTKMTRAPCRRRIGGAVPRAENVGELTTADRKVFNEGSESRNTHRYAVRGLCIAMGQYSSFCGCSVGLVLGGFDHMEDDDQDREQVEVREKVEAQETEEEDKTRKQPTLRHVMTCAEHLFMQTRRATP